MLNAIPLKCPNCGANLNIAPEMTTFACGYCGASQMVERSGGTVSLKLLTDAISKVQYGTDRTAAELAIRRLKEENAALEVNYQQIARKHRTKEYNLKLVFKLFWGFITVGLVIFGVQSRETLIVAAIAWFCATIGIIYFYSKQEKVLESEYLDNKSQIDSISLNIQQRIAAHKKVVDQI